MCTNYRLNEQKHGIEITFDSKPAEKVRAELKAAGFRWGRGYWYAVQTPARLELAERLTGAEIPAEAPAPRMTPQDHIKIYYNGLKIDGKLIKCNFCPDNGGNVYIYADSYADDLPRDLFNVRNDSNLYEDYFCKDAATVTPEHPLYKYIKYAAEKYTARVNRRACTSLSKELNSGRPEPWPGRYDSIKKDLARLEAAIKAFEAMTDPGQPSAEDLAKIDSQRQAEENARREAEQAEQQRQREQFLNDRATGRRLIDAESAAHPITPGAPWVLIHWSEHPAFTDYEDDTLKLSLSAANNVLGALDMMIHDDPDRGYYKAKFTIYGPDDVEYTGRYDLGDGEGDLVGHIADLAEWYRTHTDDGKIKENPPEVTEWTEYAAKLRALVG